jgi:class 3 adenylate cyclase/RNase P subunit RPR2
MERLKMHFRRTTFVHAPPEVIWSILADTDRMNQEAGLPSVTYEFAPRSVGGSEMYGITALGSLKFRYREQPYEWVRPHFYSVRRIFDKGPVTEFLTLVQLEPTPEGTKLICNAILLPRSPLLAPLISLAANKLMNDMARTWQGFVDYIEGRLATPYPRSQRRCPTVQERWERSSSRLHSLTESQEIANDLSAFVRDAVPEQVSLFRPFQLADRWNQDRMEVLKTCLIATRADVGLLDLRWRLLCPNCRGSVPQNTVRHLNEVNMQVHCPSCNIRYDTNFDQSVEICFRVTPAIRPAEEHIYCRGGPYMTPHVAAQWVLLPQSKQEAQVPLLAGGYTLASLQCKTAHDLTVEGDGTTEVQVTVTQTTQGTALNLSTANLTLNSRWVLHNATNEEIILRIENKERREDTATAALVTTLQAFRDQFSAEVLKPGTEIGVQQITILFTDLKGSTAMYREQGDAPSYRAVRDHFDSIQALVANHNGAVIKTIGDSVMAAFRDPADGVRTALAIQKEARHWTSGLIVKAGLHAGPALAVNANDLLDYFGQTVNLAARLLRESEGEDTILTRELAEDSVVQEVLQGLCCNVEYFTHEVRGFDKPIPMARITLPTL